MIRTFSKLEAMPREIMYNGKYYFLEVVVTAWGRLCVQYRELTNRNDTILPYVVEPENESYIPTLIAATETSGLNEHIGNCRTLDACLNAIEDKIMELHETLSEEKFKVVPNNYCKDQVEESDEIKVGDEVVIKRTGEKVKIGIITTEGEWVAYATGMSEYKEKFPKRWYSVAPTLGCISRDGYMLENEIEKV